jgi:hypothetical protein
MLVTGTKRWLVIERRERRVTIVIGRGRERSVCGAERSKG